MPSKSKKIKQLQKNIEEQEKRIQSLETCPKQQGPLIMGEESFV